MGDNRVGQGNRNPHQFDAGLNSKVDLFLRSESPRIQEILLHQKLKGEIEKNSAGRVRYVDSELYLRNNNAHSSSLGGASEVQSTTLNIGVSSSAAAVQPERSSSAKTTSTITTKNGELNDSQVGYGSKSQNRQQQELQQSQLILNKNCQVCLIRELRQDLMNINKIVQERNEQISKFKAKCLRSSDK